MSPANLDLGPYKKPSALQIPWSPAFTHITMTSRKSQEADHEANLQGQGHTNVNIKAAKMSRFSAFFQRSLDPRKNPKVYSLPFCSPSLPGVHQNLQKELCLGFRGSCLQRIKRTPQHKKQFGNLDSDARCQRVLAPCRL